MTDDETRATATALVDILAIRNALEAKDQRALGKAVARSMDNGASLQDVSDVCLRLVLQLPVEDRLWWSEHPVTDD
jgi:hypothetical protein